MGGRTGPIAARRGLAFAAAFLLAGCGGNSNVQVSGGGPQPTVSAQGNTPLGRLVLIGVIAAVGYESYKDGVYYRANPFDAIQPARPAPPPLDASRRVLEVDCSKPIEDWSANLRCR
jgi:hypothetical protein